MSRNDPFNAGTGGGPDRTPAPGTARVETRVTGSQGAASGGTSGSERAEDVIDHASDRAKQAAGQVRNRASQWGNEAEEQVREWGREAEQQVDEWTDQASDWASRARSEVGNVFERAEERLEEQTGAISLIRQNALLATGLAFGVGFLLSGDGGRRRRGILGRTTGSIRSAIIGGVSTMLMQELQEMMDEHGGPAGLISAITGGRGPERPR